MNLARANITWPGENEFGENTVVSSGHKLPKVLSPGRYLFNRRNSESLTNWVPALNPRVAHISVAKLLGAFEGNRTKSAAAKLISTATVSNTDVLGAIVFGSVFINGRFAFERMMFDDCCMF